MYRYCKEILCKCSARKYYVQVLQGNIMYRYWEILCAGTSGNESASGTAGNDRT